MAVCGTGAAASDAGDWVSDSGSSVECDALSSGVSTGLAGHGFVEGRDAAIEYRWADGQFDRLPELAADLIRRNVSVIFAAGSVAPALAAKAATATIPIIFVNGADPVQFGLVGSLNRPGGNITGVSFLTGDLGAKRLGLLDEPLPNVLVVALLVKSDNPNAASVLRDAREAARSLRLELHPLKAQTVTDIDIAFASLAQRQLGALLISADPFFTSQYDQFVRLAARYTVPTIYYAREFVAGGGLMSYGTSIRDAYRQAGAYTGKILKGDNPADLPVVQSTKFDLVINLNTANTLGLTFPPGLLAIADEVIE